MRIDTHVHITPPDIIADWESIAQGEPYFKMLSESPVNKFATADDVVEAMAEDGIDRSIVFGFGFRDMGLCRYVNDYTIDAIQRHPDKLIGFASVVPDAPGATAELVRCRERGLRGVGEIFPEGQSFDIASETAMAPFAEACLDLGFPVIFHVNEPVGHDYAGKTKTTLREAEAFAEHFPDLDVIYAHWGGGLFFYELMREVSKTLSNVYYDTAASVFLYGHKVYNVVKTLGLVDKILFATDYPLLPARRYWADLEASELDDDEKALVLGGNAERLLKKQGALPDAR